MGQLDKRKGMKITHRLAEFNDIPNIVQLMQLSIAINMKNFLSDEEIKAAQETMGVDKTLVQDKTYFVIEATVSENSGASENAIASEKASDSGDSLASEKTVMIGCGGWGKRKTLYGGDHTSGRDDSLSDPVKDAARIRAMYTHPDWTRCGVGTLLLELGESAAREAGSGQPRIKQLEHHPH